MPRVLTLFLLLVVVLAVSVTAHYWLPWLLQTLAWYNEPIQHLSTVVQLVIWVVGGGIGIYSWFRPRRDADRNLLADWLRAVATECGQLPLAVVAPRMRKSSTHLNNLYTDLDVLSVPEGSPMHGLLNRRPRGEGERTEVLAALGNTQLAVLLGDPGAGKSTLVNFLAYRLATAEADKKTAGLGKEWEHKIPARIVLRDLELRSGRGARLLWDGLRRDMRRRLGNDAGAALFSHTQDLLRERGLFLLDGLDEVPQRGLLLEAIAALARELKPGARLLVTARPWAYVETERLDGFPVLMLAALTAPQVRGFTQHWYQAIRQEMQWNEAEAARRAEDLATALEQRKDLGDLATRPLLLTLTCALHTRDARLPEDRADLYEESVNLLLFRWQSRLRLTDRAGEPLLPEDLVQLLHNNDPRLRRGLEELAFRTHARQALDQHADIPKEQALGLFAGLLENAHPKGVLTFLDQRAGLLIARGNGRFAFVHRSFQEYLAAGYLISRETADPAARAQVETESGLNLGEDLDDALAALLTTNFHWWREVFLLALSLPYHGKRIQNLLNPLHELLPHPVTDYFSPLKRLPGGQPCAPWPRAIWVQDVAPWHTALGVGLALVDLRVGERAAGKKNVRQLTRRTADWLAALVDHGLLSIREREEAGDVLDALGDPRPGVGLNEQKLPDIAWITIPEGEYLIGSVEKDPAANADEKPQRRERVEAFQISRYPLTNAQYATFIHAGGYADPHWWGGPDSEDWAWRQGADPDWSFLEQVPMELHDDYRRWIAEDTQRDAPRLWRAAPWNRANRPVVGVSWFEARAFCAWLAAQTGQNIHLPTEPQWEAAARGPSGQCYPWGNAFWEEAANTAASQLDATSAVGLFPAGASPFGLQDCSGNVMEWTTPVDSTSTHFPAITCRGAGWRNAPHWCRVAARLHNHPYRRRNHIGFRVVRAELA